MPGRASPPDDDSHDFVLVGLVKSPHGVRGEVKVEIISDVPDRFDLGRELVATAKARSGRNIPPARLKGSSSAAPRRRTLLITSFRPIRGGAIMGFDGCQTRDQAEILRGNRLEVRRSEVPAAPPGSYYHFDLLGCRCIDTDHGELGEVVDVVEDGGGVLLEVAGAGRILPVPFVEAFTESVDIAAKLIRLRLPPGLVETCASGS